MEHIHGVSTHIDCNVTLNVANNQGEKELKDITDYQAVMESLIYTALQTRPDISIEVAALFRYNSRLLTSYTTSAKRDL